MLAVLMLATGAARLHAHTVNPPDTMMQEINRCLRLVKIVASRKESSRQGHKARRKPAAANLDPLA